MISAFIMASTLICLSPGPSILVVIKHTIEGGIKRALLSILGVVLADALLLTLSISGIGVLLHSSWLLYTSVKILGAVYLIYLGGTTLLAKREKSQKREEKNSPFLGAVGVTLLNPKIIGFFIAFFPQFLNQEESINGQLALLGPLFLLIVFFVLFAYALFADRLGEKLNLNSRGFQIATGVSLALCGIASLL